MSINLTEFEEPSNSGLYLDKMGDYVMRIDSFEPGTSEVKKTPFVNFKFKNERGQIFEERFYLTPTSLWRLKRLVECALKKETHITDPDFDIESILDKHVLLSLNSESYQGKDGNMKEKLVIGTIEETGKGKDDEIDNLKEKLGVKDEEIKYDPF